MPTGAERRLFEVWRQLSQEVHRLRHTPEPSVGNELLRRSLEADRDGPLAPLLQLWIGDNFLLEGRFDEAIRAYEELIGRFPDRRFAGRPLAGIALQQIATCHESALAFAASSGAVGGHPGGREVDDRALGHETGGGGADLAYGDCPGASKAAPSRSKSPSSAVTSTQVIHRWFRRRGGSTSR